MIEINNMTFRVVPSAKTNDHEVEIFVDGRDLIARHFVRLALLLYLVGTTSLLIAGYAQTRNANTASVIVTNQNRPSYIALDEANVYWVTDSGATIKRVSKSGAAGPITVLTGQKEIQELVVADDKIFFTTADALICVGKNGESLKVLVKARTYSAAHQNLLAVDDRNVYFVEDPDKGGEQIAKIDRAGGEPVILATGIYAPNGISVDGTYVYWASYADGSISRVSIEGGAVAMIGHSISGSTCMDIAGDGEAVYAICDNDILKFGKSGTAPAKLTTIKPGFIKMALDETAIYALSYDQTKLYKIAKNGGRSELVAQFPRFRLKSFAVDATNVYWTDEEAGRIMRLLK